MSGFSELIPQELINVFDERELEVMLNYLLVWASISHLLLFTDLYSSSLVACPISMCKSYVSYLSDRQLK